MLVRFTKARSVDKRHRLTCVRDDGSVTGMPAGEFIVHDLTHYAVETTLRFTEAFFGLIAAGWDISSFEEREADSRKARQPPPQAMQAEWIVSAFDLERATGATPNEELAAYVRSRLAESGLPEIEASGDQADAIRAKRDELLLRWCNLLPGETLELVFPPTYSPLTLK